MPVQMPKWNQRMNTTALRLPLIPLAWRGFWPIVLGLLLMYVPTFWNLLHTFWVYDYGAHGPVILTIFLWLMWRHRADLLPGEEDVPRRRSGAGLIVLGLALYVVGRSQQLFVLEVGSLIPLLYGVVLALNGRQGLRALWFPIGFLVFLIPWPGSLLDAVLLPLKELVSVVVDDFLYSLGYPIARNGVVLTIGPYQLMIANACAGLNSMIALTAVGTLFVYLTGHHSRVQRYVLLASILPIALIANLLRVLALVLLTYHYGDNAGREFHDIAGYLEIVFAFGAFFLLDALVLKLMHTRRLRTQWM